MIERFEQAPQGEQFKSEYDIDSAMLADLLGRGVAPLKVITQIDLSSAGTLALPSEAGFGFVMYAEDASTKAKYAEALVNVSINQVDNVDQRAIFPAKSGRGFYGSFSKLFLQWPADSSGTYNVYFIIFKSRKYPWIGGLEAR